VGRRREYKSITFATTGELDNMAAALTQHEDSLNYGQNWDLLSDHAVGLDGALAREDAGKGRECAETAVPMQFGQA
jgi:hypothetical protein